MDWHTVLVGAASFFAGVATTIMWAAMAAAGQADAGNRQRSTHSTQHTQKTHTDTQST